MNYPFKATGL